MALKTTVVIIGASHAGIPTAHQLLKALPSAKIILINPSRLFYWNIASPRILAQQKAFSDDQFLIDIPSNFGRYSSFEFILGAVTSIDTGLKLIQVSTSGSIQPSTIQYDYLVIASGTTTQATIGQGSAQLPFKPTGSPDLRSIISKAQSNVSQAHSIIIAGGGPVGVEFAGELADTWKKAKSITLISADTKLVPLLKDSASAALLRLLRAKGVKVMLGKVVHKAELQSGGGWTVTLINGETLTADMYVASTGLLPNNSFIPGHLLNDKGWVAVNDELRTIGSGTEADKKNSIYAIGDITSNSPRLLTRLPKQIQAVVANLKSDILGKGKRVSYDHNAARLMIMVPIGKGSGTGALGGWVVWSSMVSMMKGKDYFMSQAKTTLTAR